MTPPPPARASLRWGSTRPGEMFTGGRRWQAQLEGDRFTLWVDREPTATVHLVQLRGVRLSTGMMWATCHFDLDDGATRTVDGIPNDQAAQMQRDLADATTKAIAAVVAGSASALDAWLQAVWRTLVPAADVLADAGDIAAALGRYPPPRTPAGLSWDTILDHAQASSARKLGGAWPAWVDAPSIALGKRVQAHNASAFAAAKESWTNAVWSAVDRSRWIPKGAATRVLTSFPAPEWPGRSWKQLVGDATPAATLAQAFGEHNEQYLARQRIARKAFFDTVEKQPLTDEQVHACICMDDSVMVVAAAGSGKTSTMVAKTGYALHEQLATPEQILLLAFNVATATEVGERIRQQLGNVPHIDQVKSKTFHAFGIEVIAAATGKKPDLAPWVDPGKPGGELRAIADIVQSLSDQDATFRRDWDLFRTVYGRDIGRWGERQEPEAYGDGRLGFLTAHGEIVKSKEERVLADWLYYNHVEYQYERAYEHGTADQAHRQYHPDFFYPGASLYHEHFALNAQGEAPAEFRDYLSGVAWKRRLHAEKGTAYVETTSHTLATGEAFATLEKALVERGVTPRFDPTRPCLGLPPVPDAELARTVRVFQQHVKNNGLSSAQLHRALKAQAESGYGVRLARFLHLYERIAAEWERRLRDADCIDFEDMLIQAAGHVEAGCFRSPFTVILADEFQDSSRARIRLLKALATNPGVPTHLCVVGDDWQGINRFAGSDISVMTEFEKTFEHATRLTLNTTFRCPQSLCDASSKFIRANSAQIAKTVRTTNPQTAPALFAYGFERRESIPSHIEKQLEQLHQQAVTGEVTPTRGSHVTVMVLGRYRDDAPVALDHWRQRFGDRLRIDFKTVHGSKGLEADFVFVVNVTQGTRGFPSQIQDDPVLQMAMPAPDPHPFAEERRLFYVAMTRARRQVRFYTTAMQPSQFLVELVRNRHVTIEPVDGEPMEACPECGNGVLRPRTGPYGHFESCSRFPACQYKRNAPRNGPAPRRPQGTGQRIRTAVQAGDACPKCRRGVLQVNNGRHGTFLGCTSYPNCRATANLR